jgi:hypothetical protein
MAKNTDYAVCPFEVIPEEIWRRNREYKKEQKRLMAECYVDVMSFCEEEGITMGQKKKALRPRPKSYFKRVDSRSVKPVTIRNIYDNGLSTPKSLFNGLMRVTTEDNGDEIRSAIPENLLSDFRERCEELLNIEMIWHMNFVIGSRVQSKEEVNIIHEQCRLFLKHTER